jgi:putative heme iron utilization protein
LQVYDTELILSWTPNEYRAFLRGAKHTEADQIEMLAKAAMFNRYAQNAKQASERKMFDAALAHKRIEKEMKNWKEARESVIPIEKYRKAKAALKIYSQKL